MLIDWYFLFNNLNKLHNTTKSTRVISPSLKVSGGTGAPISVNLGSNLLSNSN